MSQKAQPAGPYVVKLHTIPPTRAAEGVESWSRLKPLQLFQAVGAGLGVSELGSRVPRLWGRGSKIGQTFTRMAAG